MAPPDHPLHVFLDAHALPLGTNTELITHQSFGAENRIFRVSDERRLFVFYADAVARGARLSLCERPLSDGMPLIMIWTSR